jgi:hypothetical protein
MIGGEVVGAGESTGLGREPARFTAQGRAFRPLLAFFSACV